MIAAQVIPPHLPSATRTKASLSRDTRNASLMVPDVVSVSISYDEAYKTDQVFTLLAVEAPFQRTIPLPMISREDPERPPKIKSGPGCYKHRRMAENESWTMIEGRYTQIAIG